MDSSQSQQAKRVVFILKRLYNGKKFTTNEIHQLLNENFKNISLRTVQRDLRVLQDSDESVETFLEGKQKFFFIPREVRAGAPVNIGSNEILSLHILKAHLETFKGTVVEEDTKELERKLEELAPSNVYASDSLFWNKNIGQFDYSNYDFIIRRLINYIGENKWVKMQYRPLRNLDKSEEHICIMKSIFTYFGYLYVAAFDIKHKKYVTFAVHRIDSVDSLDEIPNIRVPKFKYKNYFKNRFGVFNGPHKLVKLKIKDEFLHYFENRFWHATQKFEKQADGSTILRMSVPIVPDLVSWILSWGEIITVVSPKELRKRVKKKLEKTLINYTGEGQ